MELYWDHNLRLETATLNIRMTDFSVLKKVRFHSDNQVSIFLKNQEITAYLPLHCTAYYIPISSITVSQSPCFKFLIFRFKNIKTYDEEMTQYRIKQSSVDLFFCSYCHYKFVLRRTLKYSFQLETTSAAEEFAHQAFCCRNAKKAKPFIASLKNICYRDDLSLSFSKFFLSPEDILIRHDEIHCARCLSTLGLYRKKTEQCIFYFNLIQCMEPPSKQLIVNDCFNHWSAWVNIFVLELLRRCNDSSLDRIFVEGKCIEKNIRYAVLLTKVSNDSYIAKGVVRGDEENPLCELREVLKLEADAKKRERERRKQVKFLFKLITSNEKEFKEWGESLMVEYFDVPVKLLNALWVALRQSNFSLATNWSRSGFWVGII